MAAAAHTDTRSNQNNKHPRKQSKPKTTPEGKAGFFAIASPPAPNNLGLLELLVKAQGDAAAFDKVYAQYKLAPDVTRRRMYYETMERVLAANDKVVAPSNVTSWLPLPELRRKAAEAPDAAGTTVTGAR